MTVGTREDYELLYRMSSGGGGKGSDNDNSKGEEGKERSGGSDDRFLGSLPIWKLVDLSSHFNASVDPTVETNNPQSLHLLPRKTLLTVVDRLMDPAAVNFHQVQYVYYSEGDLVLQARSRGQPVGAAAGSLKTNGWTADNEKTENASPSRRTASPLELMLDVIDNSGGEVVISPHRMQSVPLPSSYRGLGKGDPDLGIKYPTDAEIKESIGRVEHIYGPKSPTGRLPEPSEGLEGMWRQSHQRYMQAHYRNLYVKYGLCLGRYPSLILLPYSTSIGALESPYLLLSCAVIVTALHTTIMLTMSCFLHHYISNADTSERLCQRTRLTR